jgi:hypothetical protein
LEYKIDIEGIQETVYILKNAEPELLKKMSAEIKAEPGLNSAMSAIRSRIPTVSPLQGNQFGYGGMNHSGRTSYGGAKVSPSFKPSVRLDRGNQRSLVTIVTQTPKNAVGFEIIDMVGRGARGNSAKAVGMRRKLGGSPSRYVWKGFEERKEGIVRGVVAIIDRYAKQVNVKLRIK